MFGYLNVERGELLVKEYETFRAYYCGLCKELSKYGVKARALLSYDCAFLYLLSSALSGEKPGYETVRCLVHPVRKVPRTLTAGREYAAAANVLLGYYSLKDHAADRKNPLYHAAAGTYHSAVKKAAAKYPEAERAIKAQLQTLHDLEAQGCADLDRAADAFATMLGELFLPLSEQKHVLQVLGYHIGRYLYLIDAADDLKKDEKSGNYNPFLRRFGQDKAAIIESARYNLLSSAAGAGKALDLLDIKRHSGILENVIYLGMPKRAEAILKKLEENQLQRKETNA